VEKGAIPFPEFLTKLSAFQPFWNLLISIILLIEPTVDPKFGQRYLAIIKSKSRDLFFITFDFGLLTSD
jgi:hypothetical protein